jgi:amino acid transporter
VKPPFAPELVRGLGLFDATMLIVGSVIGSGIFVAPSIMAGYVQSPALLLGLWAVGGVLSLFGAIAYAELAAAMPRAGGQYVFLSRAFGPLSGFLYGWTFLFAINTGFIAAVAVAFAQYVGVFLPVVGEGTILFTVGRPFSTAQAVALVVVLVLTWVNVTGLRMGALVQNTFTVAKVAAVAVLFLLAFALGRGSAANFSSPGGALALGPQGVELGLFAAVAVAMSKALFAYDAWYTVAFASEEMKNPERDLVRSLGPEFFASDWTMQHATFFRAVEIEKRMMFFIVLIIIVVAAFNIVSSLMMAVKDKNADIAILRTLGASPGGITKIFLIQGTMIALLGTLLGLAGGISLALNVETVVPAIEHVLGFKFLSKDVYQITDLPSELRMSDVVMTATVSFLMTLLATIYPSWRAAKVNPAEALRYE